MLAGATTVVGLVGALHSGPPKDIEVARGRAGVAPYGRHAADRNGPGGAGRTTSSAAGAGAMGSEEGNPVRVPRATGMRWCASTARVRAGRPGARGSHPDVVRGPPLPPDAPSPPRGRGLGPDRRAGGGPDRLRQINRAVYGPPPSIRNTCEGGLRHRQWGTKRSSRDHVAMMTRASNVHQIAPSPPRSSADPCTTHLLSTPVDAVVDSG
jgi:hypothetical protein